MTDVEGSDVNMAEAETTLAPADNLMALSARADNVSG